MNAVSGVVVFFLIWWVVIFCVLPLKIKSVESTSDGTMPGAPQVAGIKWKVLLTTGITCVVWVVIYLIIRFGGISFRETAQNMWL